MTSGSAAASARPVAAVADPFRQVDLVEVRLHGAPVGVAAVDPTSRLPVFQYEPSWIDGGVDLAPLQLPLTGEPRTFPTLARTSFRGLPGLLADSLPGAFADTLTGVWLAQRGVQPGQITAVDRLAYLGSRAMGALTFHPPAGPADSDIATAFQLATATDTARRALTGRLTDRDALRQLLDISGSAGGARPKVLLATDGHRFRSGQLDAPDGWDHWLVKLDVARNVPTGQPTGLGRLEYAYHLMAVDAGLKMTPCRLIHDGDLAHFATRRFDRPGPTARTHVQSLAAIAHLPPEQAGTHTYEQHLQAGLQLGLGPDGAADGFRQVVFNIAAANRDDHTKNLAFLHDPDLGWQLAPSFDLTFPYDADGGWPVAHQMAVAGSVHGADRDTLLQLAERAKIPAARAAHIIDQVTGAVARWPDHADTAGVHDLHRTQVGQQLTATALA